MNAAASISDTSATTSGEAMRGPAAPRGRHAGDLAPGEILFRANPKTRYRSIIVIDGIIPGPALGSFGVVHDGDATGALRLALRSARSATRQAALADLPFGGGFAALIAPDGPLDHAALHESLDESVRLTQGRFQATADERGAPRPGAQGMGATTASALGMFLAIEEGLRRQRIALKGAPVAIHGLADVGLALGERLHEAGARLVVADADPLRAHAAARLLDAQVVDEARILATPCDVLVPCARGGARFATPATRIAAALVCGTAADPLFDVVDEHGLLWLPDDLVASGGLIAASLLPRRPRPGHELVEAIYGIGQRVHEFAERRGHGRTREVADAWIAEKLAARPAWSGWPTLPR